MSDMQEWIKDRRRIHNAATEGPWKQDEEDGVRGVALYTNAEDEEFEDRWERQDADIRTWDADDATAIVDAHNNLSALLTAAENVLELHQPEYLIRDGERIPANCTVCEPWTWPCKTVRAIEGAINE